MLKGRLNRRIIAKLITNTTRSTNICDGDGLYLHLTGNGSASWFVRYTSKTQKRVRNMGLGSYPAIDIVTARNLKNVAKYKNYMGIDPIDEKAADGNPVTVGEVFETWCEKKIEANKSFEKFKAIMYKHLIVFISDRPLKDITAKMISDILLKIEKEFKIHVTLHKICQQFNQMLNFAVNSGYIAFNPCLKIASCLSVAKVVHQPSIPYSESGTLFKNIASANITDLSMFLFIWNILTMVRPSEASSAMWCEIDEKKDLDDSS